MTESPPRPSLALSDFDGTLTTTESFGSFVRIHAYRDTVEDLPML